MRTQVQSPAARIELDEGVAVSTTVFFNTFMVGFSQPRLKMSMMTQGRF
jgi:hypothetical protein